MTENQKPENRQIDNEGNYNERIEGDYVQGRNNFLNNNFIFGRPSSNEPLTLAKNSRIRQQLLKQVDSEVEKRLESSLHNRVYIALNVEQNPEQIELPWASEIKVGNLPKTRLDNTDIINVFDKAEIAGRLLILGQPGAGKTTMLLLLASSLVNRAKNNQSYPVPVLFSLSSWKKDQQNIKDWLVEQLKDKYGVRQDIGKEWVNNQEIIPLLDGLDELAAERQEKCVIKINEFLDPKTWNNPVVICSRIEEYQRYTTLLQLNNSLELDPFSPQQVYQYLQNTGNSQLWNSISGDADLSQLAKTPLLLNIIVLSAEEISIQTWQQFDSSEDRLSYLFDAYIRRMFKRPYRGKGKQPKQENTQRWLSWLAQRLIEESATEFLIEKMQPNWLKSKLPKIIYSWIVWSVIGSLLSGLIWGCLGLIFYNNTYSLNFGLFNGLIIGGLTGIIFGLFPEKFNKVRDTKFIKENIIINTKKLFSKKTINGVSVGLISVLIYGVYILTIIWLSGFSNILDNILTSTIFSDIFIGLLVGVAYGLVGETIQTIETLNFSIKNSLNSWRDWLIGGLIVGLIGGLITELYELLKNNSTGSLFENLMKNLFIGIFLGLLLGLIGGFIGGIVSGITGLEIERKTYPNQGIWRSINNCIILSLATSFFSSLIIFTLEKILKNQQISQLLINSLSTGMLFGLFIGIPRSGTPTIKHFILRVILWFSGYIPWNYAKFLNYSTQRLFLQQVGGGYRFIHDLLRQHFANLSTQINLVPTDSNSRIVNRDFKNILLVLIILMSMVYPSWQFNLHYITAIAYNDRGLAYDDKKEYALAFADYNQALQLDPNYAIAYNNRGLAYYNTKEYALAFADYNQALQLDPNLALAYNNRGLIYDNKKEYALAIADYTQALQLDPNYATAYYNRGLVYKNKKEYALAIADYTQALQLNPNDATAYYNRGLVYKNKKEYNLAIADYTQALKLDPNYAIAYNNRGLVYKNKKEYDLAIADYTQAIKLNPNYAIAYNNRGLVYKNKKEYDLAIADYTQAIKLNPNYAYAYNNRGLAYKNKGSKEKAIKDFKKVLELNNNIELSEKAKQELQKLGNK